MWLAAFAILSSLANHQTEADQVEFRVLLGFSKLQSADLFERNENAPPERRRMFFEISGEKHISKGEHELAVAAFAKAVSLTPNDPSLYVKLARAHVLAGRTKEGIAYMEEVLRKNPNNATCLAYLARELVNLDRSIEAEPFASKAIALDPTNSLALSVRAVCRRDAKQWQFAIDDLNRVLLLSGGESILKTSSMFCMRGSCHSQLGRQVEAVNDFLHATKVDPDWLEGWILLGHYLTHQAHPARIYEPVAIVLEKYADRHYQVSRVVAKLHIRMKHYNKADNYLNKALSDNPNLTDCKRLLAVSAYFRGDYESAKRRFEDLVKEKASETHLIDLSMFLTSCPNPDLRDNIRALTLARQASEMSKTPIPETLLALANAFASIGNREEAIRALEQVEESDKVRFVEVDLRLVLEQA